YPEPEVPSGMTDDRYIKWIQVLPGDTKVTHHVLVFALSTPPAGGAPSSTAAGPAAGGGAPDLAAIAAQFGIEIPSDPAELAALREQIAQFARGGIPTVLTEYARGNGGYMFQDGE